MVNREIVRGQDGDIFALHVLDIDDKLHPPDSNARIHWRRKICGRIGHKLAEVLFRAQDDL
jgi:hypothetical protein